MNKLEAFRKNKTLPVLVLAAILILQLFIYMAHVGNGFIKDDFVWLGNVIVDGQMDYFKPFKISTGFYRPLVSLTFGIQYQIHGMNPKPYGLFNLFLHMLNILLVYMILSRNKETYGFALLATVLFALNAKGNRMAIGWISARTSLLFSFFILLALYLYLNIQHRVTKGERSLGKTIFQYFLISLSFLAALLSKETAMGLPLFIFLYTFFNIGKRNGLVKPLAKLKASVKSLLLLIPPVFLYFLLRFSSDAFTPFTAPDTYRYTFSPLVILKNISEYIIRAGMFDIIIALFLVAVLPFITQKRDQKQKITFSPIGSGLLWFFAFLLPSVLIPVRSDLYTYFPQVGLHITFLASIFLVFQNRKLKKPEYLIHVLIPIALVGAIWIGHLFVKAVEIGKQGQNSSLFIKQMTRTIATVRLKKRLCIVDRDMEKKHSPSTTISYGFHSLLNLYYPKQNLTGFIIPHQKALKMKRRRNMSYFIWENNGLNGPYGYRRLKKLITK